MSKHTVSSCDVADCGRGSLSSRTRCRSARAGRFNHRDSGGGLDGFWIHRLLQDEGVESHVVDPASIATSRRRRRAKTDKIDGKLCARVAGVQARRAAVCAMVRAPTPQEEDRRPDLPRAQDADSGAGSSTSIGSRGCSSPRVSPTMNLTGAKERERLEELRTVMVVCYLTP